jgi:hypothetical protein
MMASLRSVVEEKCQYFSFVAAYIQAIAIDPADSLNDAPG